MVPSLPGQRIPGWIEFAAATAALASVMWLAVLRHKVPVSAGLPNLASPPPVGAWPILDVGGDPPELRLPIRGFVPRGALRIESGLEELQAPTLVLVSNDDGPARLLERTPDYTSPGCWEYYGLVAGDRAGFVRCGERTSDVLRVVIERGALASVRVDRLDRASHRQLDIRALGSRLESGATVLLSYDGFELLEPWLGEPLALARPLTSPRRVTVRAADGPAGAPNLGVSLRVDEGDGPILVELDRGNAVLTLASWDTPRTQDEVFADEFALSATPAVSAQASNVRATPLLACVRNEEFEIPPTIHSWARAESEAPAAIHGLRSGRHRIAAGLEGRGRYTVWRTTEVDNGAVVAVRLARVSAPAPSAERDRLRLPDWISSFAPSDAMDAPSRERRLHPAGPSEVWRRIDGDGSELVHRAGWRTGTGVEFAAATAELVLDLPSEAEGRTRECWLRVFASNGDSTRAPVWAFHATRLDVDAQRLVFVPDGEMEGRIALEDGDSLVCRARVRAGAWESPPSWTLGESPRASAQAVEASVARGRSRTIEASTTDGAAFDRIGRALGLELSSVGIDSVSLLEHPEGAERDATRANGDLANTTEHVVEVLSVTSRVALWGLMRPSDDPNAGQGARASVSILNRTRSRTLRLTLPCAELVLELRPGEVRTLNIAAPARIALLSVIRTSAESALEPEEGVEIELRPDDALVAEYE
jgi:hypothetical protein